MRLLQLVLAAAVAQALPQKDLNSAGSINPKTGQPFTMETFQSTIDFMGSTANDLRNLKEGQQCKEIYLIVARGSMEGGNLGVTTGPMLCKKMRQKYGARLGCQGVDPKAYTAGFQDNGKPKGTADEGIAAGVKEFNDGFKKCPKSLYVFSGYSQGAALMHSAVPQLSGEVKKQLVGGVLFGDTRNDQTNATITGYPKDDLLVICAKDDMICWRRLNPSASFNGHLVYTQNGDVDRGVAFLSGKIDAAAKKRN